MVKYNYKFVTNYIKNIGTSDILISEEYEFKN